MADEQEPLTGQNDSSPPCPKDQDKAKDDPSTVGRDSVYADEKDADEKDGAVRLASERGSASLNYAFHVCLCGGFFGLGIVLCMLGPTLLDLADQAGGASVREISLVFTSRSFAYLCGSVLGGYLLERMENTCMMLAAAMYLVAIGSAGLPLCTEIWSMGCFMACAGVAM